MMQNNWDAEIPLNMTKKLNILLNQRSQLVQQDSTAHPHLNKRHQEAVRHKSRECQKSVERLLDKEKSCLLTMMDDDLARRASPALRTNNSTLSASQVSSISFSESHNHRINNRSVSTAFTGQLSPYSSHDSAAPPPKSVPAFSAVNKSENGDLLLQLSLKVNEQQLELQQLRKEKQHCDCQDLTQMKDLIQQKLTKQRELYENLLEVKDQELKDVNMEENTLLKCQLKELRHTKHQQELQMNLFKEGLIKKLNTYAIKLDQLNEKELTYARIEQDNVRLQKQKEELELLLSNLTKKR